MTDFRTAGIIATYNQEAYIGDAVDGLVDQVDELIVVDDASTDNTQQVLASIKHPRLRVLRNETQSGVSGAYNRAVEAASAEIILIQGGDDRSLPGRSARQRDILRDPGVSLVCSLPSVIDSRGNELPDDLAGEFLIGRTGPDPLTFLFFQANYICAPAVALRREDYLRLAGFRLGLDLLQDYDLWLSLAVEGRFVILDEPVVEYRKHGMNLSREYVGLDSPRRRRYSAEMEFVRNRFLDSAAPLTLYRLAQHLGLDLARFEGLTAPEQRVLIRLSHPDRLVVRRGVNYLFETIGSPRGENALDRLGVTRTDLNRLSALADNDNLGDVSRALGIDRTLDRISAL